MKNMRSIFFARHHFEYSLLLFLFFLLSTYTNLSAQSDGLPYQTLDLTNLESFQQTTENWMIAGEVLMDLYERHNVQPADGTGILVNNDAGDDPQDIFTTWEHGDLDLELEFMMAKESNSGIYFQGRYELQMLDSWGVDNPKFYDMGGVYQWWENGEGVGGIPPRANASRAPGLWQHLEVRFRAPRFDNQGEKIAHARLEEVKLNGVMIHRNVDLVHPTGGAVSNEEVGKDALRFQGDHGPVAFRNIRYKKYEHEPVELVNLEYRFYQGEFESATEVEEADPEREGALEAIDLEMLTASGEIGVIYRGEIQIEMPGTYYFDVRSDGGHRLTIGDEVLSERDDEARRWDSNAETIDLESGSHSFEMVYFRGARGGQPALGLMAEGPGIRMHNLHAESALPINQQNPSRLLEPERRPIVHHGFMEMGEKVHTHTAAVGFPSGTHYAFDQNNGSLMKFWKGDFVDYSSTWVGRGGGNISLNREASLEISGGPPMAYLSDESAAWPDTLQEGAEYRLTGYQLDEGYAPVFIYRFDHVSINDRIMPEEDGKILRRSVEIELEDEDDSLFYRILKGDSISWLPNGLYQVDDKRYYLKLDSEVRRHAWIRETTDGKELLIQVNDLGELPLSYSIIW